MSVIIPTVSEIRANIAAQFIAAYGTDLDISGDTPDGQLISNISESYYQLYQLLQAVYNNSKIYFAQDQALDDLLVLNNIPRLEGTQSVCYSCLLTGTDGTVIPAGSEATSSSGNNFYSAFDATISGTTAVVDFISDEIGSIKCSSGQLNAISTPVTGWSAINNPTDAVVGKDKQTDSASRARFLGLIGQYSLGYVGVIKSLVLAVVGVNDAFPYNNATGDVSPDPYSTPANSIAVLVDYVDETIEDAIAQAIFSGKPPVSLAAFADGTLITKTVQDAAGIDQTIRFSRAVKVDLYVDIILTETSQTGTDIETIIKTIVSDYINMNSRINQKLIYTKVVGTVSNIDTRIEIEHFYISTNSTPTSDDIVDIQPNYYQIFILNPANITISVNTSEEG